VKAGDSIGEEDPSDPCPICASSEAPDRFELREMLFGWRETFAYLRCPSCGALRIANVPTDLGRHYPPDYYGEDAGSTVPRPSRSLGLSAMAGAARDRSVLLGRGRRRARLLRRWAPPVAADVRRSSVFTRRAGLRSFDDPILDVGCGRRATNLATLRSVGFRRLLGIDPFLEADGDYEGIPLRKQSIHDVTGSFQAITFHHSFEHVPDPEATMVAAARHLRPGGVVLIRTPVMGTWFWERFGTAWWELDPPRHLWLHTQGSLERIALAAGLSLVDVVWDSTYVEVIASDQIARDIAWREPASWSVAPPAGFDEATIASYQAMVADLNRSGRAGRAGFYFRAADGAGRASAA
jgi:SAM-dependent methyltransferase